MAIVDAQGKPILNEIASIERDPSRMFFGKVLTNADDTLLTRGRGKGLKIYDELKRDAHAGAVLAKRKLAVTSRPWAVKPASEKRVDVKAADLVQMALEKLRFNHVCKRLLEATLKGYAVSEVMWELRDGFVLPKAVIARAPQRFVFSLQGDLHLLTPENGMEGEAMPPRKFIVHRRGADDDNPYGMGLGGMLFWPVFFKRQGITFWLTFADKFGSPTALGRYPQQAPKSEQNQLLAALKAISQDAGIIIPEGMEVELLEAARSGSVDTYEKLVRYMDEQMSKAVLGETMSTTAASAGLGSNQANVQNDVRLEVAKDDGDELDETLNDSIVKWIVEYNMPGAGLPRVERDFAEPEDLSARATRDKTLWEMGWQATEDYVIDTYGEGFERKPEPQPPTQPMPGELGAPGADDQAAGQAMGNTAQDPAEDDEAASFAEGKPLQRALQNGREAQQLLVDASTTLASRWRVLMGRRVQDLMSLLDDTRDLVTFKERMGQLLETDPDPKAVQAIARSTFAAHALGRGASAQGPVKPASKKR